MKPVPQIGPEQPPTLRIMIMLIFCRKPPIELRSSSFHSWLTTRKPEASETPKSASPAYESSSQKYCSFFSAVAVMLLMAVSKSASVISRMSASPKFFHATRAAMAFRSFNVMRTFGASPSSGTIRAASRKSSSSV